MTSVSQLGYLGLSVSDMTIWEQFATEVLGLAVSEHADDGSLHLRMDEYHHRFLVHPTGNDDLAYIGWEVADEHALHALAKQLRAADVEVTPGTPEELATRRVAGLIRFRDPSGIPSEIFYGPLVHFDKPFQSPRPISGFKTGEQGLGHFVILVNDAAQSINFYRDVLGMRISDYVHITPAPGVTFSGHLFPLQSAPSFDRLCRSPRPAQTLESFYAPDAVAE